MAQPPDPDRDMARIRRRKSEATAKGGQAFLRLLLLAEHHESAQATRIAGFIASTYNGQVLHSISTSCASLMKPSPTTCCCASTRCAGRRPTCIRWSAIATGARGRIWSSTDGPEELR